MNARIAHNDQIEIRESTAGEPGHITIDELEEYKSTVNFIVNDKLIVCPKFAYVGGELKGADYSVQPGDNIIMENYYTVKQLFDFMDVGTDGITILVNNDTADNDTVVYENFNVKYFDAEPENGDDENSVKKKEQGNPGNKTEEVSAIPSEPVSVTIEVNNTSVVLSGKSRYTFVDVFDFYPFDLKTPGGTELITTLNGEKVPFTAPITAGDKIELYWR